VELKRVSVEDIFIDLVERSGEASGEELEKIRSSVTRGTAWGVSNG
jgi:hypothetical protein